MLVISIKLGIKTCGFALQALSNFINNPTIVMLHTVNTGTSQGIEFPTSLFLARNGNVSFGYEAQNIFTDSRGGGVFFGNFGESIYLSEVCNFHPNKRFEKG